MKNKAIRVIRTGAMLVWLVVSTFISSILVLIFGHFSRNLALRIGFVWCRILIFLSGIRLKIEGRDQLTKGKGYMFVSNHASVLDILVLIAGLPHPVLFMAKKELFRVPIFGWALTVSGQIPIDRFHPGRVRRSLDRAKRILGSGKASLIAFPEGTRSRTGVLGEFKLGAFSLAISARIPAVPVCIRGTFESMPKGSLLYDPGEVTVHIGKPIIVKDTERHDKSAIAQTAREEILRLMGEGR